jgi:hypothetical protein
MTHGELVAELRAMREAMNSLDVQVAQLDLMAKRTFLSDPEMGEVAALYAEDVRGSLVKLTGRVAFLAAALKGGA